MKRHEPRKRVYNRKRFKFDDWKDSASSSEDEESRRRAQCQLREVPVEGGGVDETPLSVDVEGGGGHRDEEPPMASRERIREEVQHVSGSGDAARLRRHVLRHDAVHDAAVAELMDLPQPAEPESGPESDEEVIRGSEQVYNILIQVLINVRCPYTILNSSQHRHAWA